MNLRNILRSLHDYPEHLVIYASPTPRWSAASPVRVIAEPADGSLPPDAAGLTYLMAVYQAQRVIDIWRECRPGLEPSDDDLCDAVVYYARHDAHLPALETAV